MVDLAKKQETKKVYQFLMGLDDSIFEMVRLNILSTEPLPGLMRVYFVIVQEEQHRNIARGREERGDVGSFCYTDWTEIGRSKGKEKIVTCTYYGRIGHDEMECSQKIGYPKWWGDHSRVEGRGVSHGRGDLGGSRGGRGSF